MPKIVIETNFSFPKLASKYRAIKKELLTEIIENEANAMRDRVATGTTIDGTKMKPIKNSTVLTRSINNHSINTPPLNASGRPLKSIRATKKGISVKEYGSIQSSGFTPKKIPHYLGRQALKKSASKRRIVFKDNTKNIRVPARQFIHTEETFNSLRTRKKIRRKLISKVNQALKK